MDIFMKLSDSPDNTFEERFAATRCLASNQTLPRDIEHKFSKSFQKKHERKPGSG